MEGWLPIDSRADSGGFAARDLDAIASGRLSSQQRLLRANNTHLD